MSNNQQNTNRPIFGIWILPGGPWFKAENGKDFKTDSLHKAQMALDQLYASGARNLEIRLYPLWPTTTIKQRN